MEEEDLDVYEIIEIEEEHIVIDDDDDDEVKLANIQYNNLTKSFKCEVCFESFSTKNLKIEHHKTHKGEKLFKCEFCSKLYQKEQGLKEHINYKHTQLYPRYKCNRCMNSFSRKRDFIDHRVHCVNVDTMLETKTYKCEKCDKIYASLLFLKVHMKKHS